MNFKLSADCQYFSTIFFPVTECVPLLPELDELLGDLNKTDNLRRFVIQVRRRFCALSSSKEPLNDCTNDPS